MVYKKSKSAIEPNEDELVVEGIEQVNEVPEEVERASVVLHSFDELSVEDEGCWSSVDDRESLLDDELDGFFVFFLYKPNPSLDCLGVSFIERTNEMRRAAIHKARGQAFMQRV